MIVADSNGNATDATNLFAFGPDGHPIDHVRIYDQDGHPVVVQDQDTADCYAGVDRASSAASAAPTASPLPSNVYPREQVTPQLDTDGNPTGVCTIECRDTGLRSAAARRGRRKSLGQPVRQPVGERSRQPVSEAVPLPVRQGLALAFGQGQGLLDEALTRATGQGRRTVCAE